MPSFKFSPQVFKFINMYEFEEEYSWRKKEFSVEDTPKLLLQMKAKSKFQSIERKKQMKNKFRY